MFTKFKKFHKKEYGSDKEHAHRSGFLYTRTCYVHVYVVSLLVLQFRAPVSVTV